MVEGEYESQKALAAIIPDKVIIPMAWGMLEADKSKAFFITQFRDMCDDLPPTVQYLSILKKYCNKMAMRAAKVGSNYMGLYCNKKLHRMSAKLNGKFESQVPTYNGPPRMVYDWTDSWGRVLCASIPF